MSTADSDNPGIKLPPPVIFLFFFLAAIALKHFIPLFEITAPIRLVMGVVLAIAGFLIIALALSKFRSHRTSVLPDARASSMIQDGIFARTRNPIYLAFVLLYLAAGFYFQVNWIFILLPFLIVSIQTYAIGREEAYLERRFGRDYLTYKQRVKRWL